MSEQEYDDYFRHESGDPADLTAFLVDSLSRLAAVGITPYNVDYKPDLHYAEVNFILTMAQAKGLGYDEDEMARLVEEAGG